MKSSQISSDVVNVHLVRPRAYIEKLGKSWKIQHLITVNSSCEAGRSTEAREPAASLE